MKHILLSIYFNIFLVIHCLAQNQALPPDNDFEERIYLHTNSSFLLVGESLLFKAYCLNSVNHIPSALSTIAYIDLIDENATPVLQTKISLQKGNGYGDFFLPSTLISGNYTLIAYTHWMKNFPTANFFRTQVTIINPFRKPSNPTPKKKPQLNITFSPEGGKLIAGIHNTVAFNVTSEQQSRANFTGKVLDETGNTILDFTAAHNGTGRFDLTPVAGKVYKAVVIDSLQNIYFQPLPAVIESGIAIHVTEKENVFQINLTSHGMGKNATVKMIIHQAEHSLGETGIQFTNEEAQYELQKASLPFGISLLSILDSRNEVICERYIFNKPPAVTDIDIKLEAKKYQNRQKVSLSINTKDTLSAHLSISVKKIEKKINDYSSLAGYLFWGDDHQDLSLLHEKEVDNQMLLLTRNAYSNNITIKKSTSLKYLPEIRNNLITGIVTLKDNTRAIHEKVYLSIPAKAYLFFASLTDSTGRFYFNTDKIKSSTDIILQTNPSSCLECQIKLDRNELEDYTDFKPIPLAIDSSFRKLIEQRSVFVQVENAYYSQKQDSILDRSEVVHFYGKPDKSYLLDDYVRFPTMEDILIEYVAEIILKKKGSEFEIKVMNLRKREAFTEDPLILIDGIPIFDLNQLMNYNPLLLKKIEIVGKRYFYGPLETQGIISVNTYDGTGNNLSVTQKEQYQGIMPHKLYYSPTYNETSTSLAKIPDYRTQLYWNPDVELSGKPMQLDFFTSDVDGDFEIVVQGIQADGKPTYHRQLIHVGDH